VDDALEGPGAESEAGGRGGRLALFFALGLLAVGAMVALSVALWRWGPSLLERRGIVLEGLTTPTAREEEPQAPKHAQVVNTEGKGLRLRSQPGVGARVVGQLAEGMVVEMVAGPVQADGYEWWEVSHQGQRGWCAANWLRTSRPTEGPAR
jgi:hypothetical protein